MTGYRHRQVGTWTNAAFAAVVLVGLAATLQAGVVLVFLPVFLLFAAICVTFWSLTVEVQQNRVSCWFGSGWPRRDFQVSDIRSAEAVRNRWWYGFGIRLTPHGWMYNLGGLDAVEIGLTSGKSFRIGTPQPRELEQAIRQAAGL